MSKLEAQLEAFPGSSVGYDCGGEFGMAVFDQRCRWCARFVKPPNQITLKALILNVEVKAPTVCSQCDPVELVFEGFY